MKAHGLFYSKFSNDNASMQQQSLFKTKAGIEFVEIMNEGISLRDKLLTLPVMKISFVECCPHLSRNIFIIFRIHLKYNFSLLSTIESYRQAPLIYQKFPISDIAISER